MTEDLFGRLSFRIDLLDKTKTSSSGQRHYLEGAQGLTGDPRIDPVLALGMYLLVRGEDDGFLFVRYNETSAGTWEHDVRLPLKDAKFLDDLRAAFDEAGVDAYRFLGTHSFKRGGVQLYRLLGVPDDEIKSRGNWSSFSAYTAYVQASNRLEKRFCSASPQAALADIIVRGGEVPECVLVEVGLDAKAVEK